ncbi:MAG: FMN-binding protein [Fusobacteriaceae bacterium]
MKKILITLFVIGSLAQAEVLKGEWTGYLPLKVSVVRENGVIKSFEVTEKSTDNKAFKSAYPALQKSIVEKNSVEVDSISGATATSTAIIGAIKDALKETN